MTFTRFATATLTAVTLAWAVPLAAEESAGSAPAESAATGLEPTPGLTAETVTETQVNAFVDALVAVEGVRTDYRALIRAEEDPLARSVLLREARVAVLQAVEGVEHMSAPDYLAIGQAAAESDALNARILARIDEVVPDADAVPSE